MYLRMFLKSEPMKASATSHFQSSLVSADVVGAGFRLSWSYGQMKRKYRLRSVHRDRISLLCPATGFPRLSFSTKMAGASRQKAELGSVSEAVSLGARLLSA